MKRIGVIGIEGGWSSETLAAAVYRRTGFCPLIDMNHVCFDISSGEVHAKRMDLTSFDALIVKKVSATYSPDMMHRLEILCYLSRMGVKIFSSPQRIGCVVDRLNCTIGLRQADIPVPETVVTASEQEALAAVKAFGKAVFKPLFTSKARGMVIIEDDSSSVEKIMKFKDAGNPLMYIQRVVDLPGRDLGITFLGGKYVGTYARVKAAGAWSSTTSEGGRYEAYEPSPDIIELARRAQEPFGLDFTCVDLAESDEGPVVFEVSAFGGFKGLLQANGIDAAGLYADYVMERLEAVCAR